jgi:2,3-dihydroxybenzoate-AMP ligase
MTQIGCPFWPKEFADWYRKEGCWRGETFGAMLRERARSYGDRIAVTAEGRSLSYAELDERARRLAAGFQKLGIEKGDRAVIQLPNIVEFFEVIFALFKLGAWPVFALPSHRSSEINYFCRFTEAVAYIIPGADAEFDYRVLARGVKTAVSTLQNVIVAGDPGEFLALTELYGEAILQQPEVSPGEVAFLQLSGGSTGLPKLIPRTHDDYIYSLRASNEICRMNQDSVYLAALPVAHNYPLSSPGALGALYAGGRVVLATGGSPDEAFPLIEKERVTIAALVPPLALIWLEAAASRRYDLTSLEVLQVGGAKFSEEAAQRVKPAFGCTLQQVYGMAEGLVNYTRLDDPEETIVSTQGRPMSRYDELRVVDEDDCDVKPGAVGQLLTRGPYTIRGYYKAEADNMKAFTPDGFYRTGDLARVDESGNIVVEGRAKDQINRGGEKIAAAEVENYLLAHEAILDAAIVAMPDQFLGERSCAFVIPRRPVTAAEIKQFIRERGIAAFKIPDRVEFISVFPYTPLGKVSKKALRDMIANKLGSQVDAHP